MRKHGIIAEKYFKDLIMIHGYSCDFMDEYYDFLLNNNVKVEVKSASLGIANSRSSKKEVRIGRFDFTNKENFERLKSEQVWVCLIVRYGHKCLLLGFIQAQEIEVKRYLPVHMASILPLIPLGLFLKDYIE